MHFFYDAQNKPAVVVYNGTPYSYVKNLQGDIVALLDSTGTVVVSYVYDAWGRPISKTGSLSSTLGTVHPFRYRGYVYDEETGLYYLRSRYYNVQQCQFINADVLYSGNLYSYCKNMPIIGIDKDGFAVVCCFDENGFASSFMTQAMMGGGSALPAVAFSHRNSSSIQQRAASKGVSFENNGDGNGGRIYNSYKLLPWEMIEYTQYLEEQHGDIYKGSDIGYYFEWAAHNFGYYAIDALNAIIDVVEPIIGQRDITVAAGMQDRFSDFDFGATIYNDYADHGPLSFVFFVPYRLLFPQNSTCDMIVYCTNAQ